MSTVGAQGKHRAPARYRPDHTYRNATFLLGIVSGLALAGAQEAKFNNDSNWTGFFGLLFCIDAYLYFYMAWLWYLTRE